MPHLAKPIATVYRASPKRGSRCIHGRSQSPFLVKLEGETVHRRVYEDWNRLDQRGSRHPRDWAPVPLVIIVKGEILDLTDDHRSRLDTVDYHQAVHWARVWSPGDRKAA